MSTAGGASTDRSLFRKLAEVIAEMDQAGILATVSVEVTFVDGETGETLRATMGQASDKPGDRSASRAPTSAVKLSLLHASLTGRSEDQTAAQSASAAPGFHKRDQPRPAGLPTVTPAQGPARAAQAAPVLLSSVQRAALAHAFGRIGNLQYFLRHKLNDKPLAALTTADRDFLLAHRRAWLPGAA